MYIHDLIKIKYVDEGYLPNYPYHLISTEEMCDAFICTGHEPYFKNIDSENETYFNLNYYKPVKKIIEAHEDTKEAFEELVKVIKYYVNLLRGYTQEEEYKTIPDWVYSYMLGSVVNPKSKKRDIHDIIYPLGVDNVDDEFTYEVMKAIYDISKKAVKNAEIIDIEVDGEKITRRPATIYGEPLVIKAIRLDNENPMA